MLEQPHAGNHARCIVPCHLRFLSDSVCFSARCAQIPLAHGCPVIVKLKSHEINKTPFGFLFAILIKYTFDGMFKSVHLPCVFDLQMKIARKIFRDCLHRRVDFLFVLARDDKIIRISHIVIHARQLHNKMIEFLQRQMPVPPGCVKAFRDESAAARTVFNRDFLMNGNDTVIYVQKSFVAA